MNPMEWGYLLTGLAAVAGVIWTIYNGRKTNKHRESASAISRANLLLERYEKDMERKDKEISRLEGRIEQLTGRITRVESMNGLLLQYLARAWKVPADMIEFQLRTGTLKEPTNDAH